MPQHQSRRRKFVSHNDLPDEAGPRGDQVVDLLNQLGSRMVRGEKERLHLIAQLQRYDETLTRLDTTDAALREWKRGIEAEQRGQAERLARAEALSRRIEDAIAQQNRLTRRLEKIVQDKARMIAKIESIEATVIETREALDAKALVLLTDRAAAEKTDAPQLPASAKLPAGRDGEDGWWNRSLALQAAGVSALVLIAAFSGWAVTRMAQEQSYTEAAYEPAPAEPQEITAALNESVQVNPDIPPSAPSFTGMPVMPDPIAAAPVIVEPPPADAENPVVRIAEAMPPAADEAPPEVPAEAAEEPEVSMPAVEPAAGAPDPVRMSTDELLQQFEDDPDGLAGAMNGIEPAAGDAAASVEETPAFVQEAFAPAAEAEPAADPAAAETSAIDAPADARARELSDPKVLAFIESQRNPRPLAERIPADPALPPVIKEVEAKAFAGVPEAQHDLAAVYTAGHGGVGIDYSRAAQWFREAALGGIANARYNLGVLYHQGLGIEKDTARAINWYRAAALLGHPEAQYNLGIAHIEGTGATYDPPLAARFFENAAKGGIVEAAYNLGLIHENGLLGGADPREALYWYRRAAAQGSPEAKLALDQLVRAMNIRPADIDAMFRDRMQEEAADASESAPATAAPTPIDPAKLAEQEASIRRTAREQRIEAEKKEPVKEEAALTPEPEFTAPGGAPPPPHAANPSPPGQDQAVMAQIQEQLIRLGLYPGPADGVGNPLMADAVRSYQAAHGLERTGLANQALLVHMLTSELEPAAGEGSAETAEPLANTAAAQTPVAPGSLTADDMAGPAE